MFSFLIILSVFIFPADWKCHQVRRVVVLVSLCFLPFFDVPVSSLLFRIVQFDPSKTDLHLTKDTVVDDEKKKLSKKKIWDKAVNQADQEYSNQMVYLLFVCVVPLPCSRFHSLFLA
jgi:hypothetical protein